MHLQNAFERETRAVISSSSDMSEGPCRPGDILHPHPQARTTRSRTWDRTDSQLGYMSNRTNAPSHPNTHCDAGDVLLALVARHLSPVVRLAPRRGPLSMQRDVLGAEGDYCWLKRGWWWWWWRRGSWSRGEATNVKNQNYLSNSWTRPGCLPVSADAPNLSFPDGVRQEGREEGPLVSLFPIKRTPRSMRRASPCSHWQERATNAINCSLWISEGRAHRLNKWRNTQQPS